MKCFWLRAVSAIRERLFAYVAAKTVLVSVMLLLLWALKDKDVAVVYMKF